MGAQLCNGTQRQAHYKCAHIMLAHAYYTFYMNNINSLHALAHACVPTMITCTMNSPVALVE